MFIHIIVADATHRDTLMMETVSAICAKNATSTTVQSCDDGIVTTTTWSSRDDMISSVEIVEQIVDQFNQNCEQNCDRKATDHRQNLENCFMTVARTFIHERA